VGVPLLLGITRGGGGKRGKKGILTEASAPVRARRGREKSKEKGEKGTTGMGLTLLSHIAVKIRGKGKVGGEGTRSLACTYLSLRAQHRSFRVRKKKIRGGKKTVVCRVNTSWRLSAPSGWKIRRNKEEEKGSDSTNPTLCSHFPVKLAWREENLRKKKKKSSAP